MASVNNDGNSIIPECYAMLILNKQYNFMANEFWFNAYLNFLFS